MIAHKNRISDIQGKYAEKDRRNFMNSEFGKTIGQFKVWMPDWFKERFGEKYITADGTEHTGTYRTFIGDGFKDMREQIKKVGLKEFALNSDTPEAKNFRSNLKGLLTIGALLSIRMGADDDEKVRRKGDAIDQMIGNILFIFDPTGLKFTIKNPVAAIGTLSKFVDVIDYALPFEDDDFYKQNGRFGDKGDPKLFGSLVQVVPFNKMLINELTFPKEK